MTRSGLTLVFLGVLVAAHGSACGGDASSVTSSPDGAAGSALEVPIEPAAAGQPGSAGTTPGGSGGFDPPGDDAGPAEAGVGGEHHPPDTAGGAAGVAGGAGAAGEATVTPIDCALDPWLVYADIAYLASDELRGRLPGDIGNELALQFAEAEFARAGLSPAGDDGGYRQYFDDEDVPDIANVLGMIPGQDPELSDEVIVVGAHIDHIGVNDDGSVNHGADDNASGAAVVMELARMFQRCALQPRRTLLFAQWNAEEMGILGSRHYVQSPTLPLEDTIAAYNFDMVGAGDGTGILLFGGDDAPNRWLTDLMMGAADAGGLAHVIELVPQKLASDHAPFAEAGIPVQWGFSRPDPHPGYHTPADDISRIRIDSLTAVAELFWAALRPLALAEEDGFLN